MVLFSKDGLKFVESGILNVSVTVLSPKFIMADRTPVAAPPKRVAISVFPKTKSLPPSKICGKILTIC